MNSKKHLIWALCIVVSVGLACGAWIRHDQATARDACEHLLKITPEKYKWEDPNILNGK